MHSFAAEMLNPSLVAADCALRLGSEEHHGQQVSLGGESGGVRPVPRHDPHDEPPQQPKEKQSGRNTYAVSVSLSL